MTEIVPGKLYTCSGCFLLIFPDRESCAISMLTNEEMASFTAMRETKKIGKTVHVARPGDAVFVLSVDNTGPSMPWLVYYGSSVRVEVLAGGVKGWISCGPWLPLVEIHA